MSKKIFCGQNFFVPISKSKIIDLYCDIKISSYDSVFHGVIIISIMRSRKIFDKLPWQRHSNGSYLVQIFPSPPFSSLCPYSRSHICRYLQYLTEAANLAIDLWLPVVITYKYLQSSVESVLKMGKSVSKRHPKRTFRGNQHVSVASKVEFKSKRVGRPLKKEKVSFDQLEMPSVDGPSPFPIAHSTPLTGKSVAFKKLSTRRRLLSSEKSDSKATGYRILDMDILFGIFRLLMCPECMSKESLMLEDDLSKKNGCANHLKLVCLECHWFQDFYTSKQTKGTFEVNRRVVYGMRSIGNGYAGAKKFCAVMNIPTLPTKNNYGKINRSLHTAVYEVANESMKQAGEEIRRKEKSLTECGVSVDGCWQKRGFVSLNGCVAALSIDTGKVLDVEPMSRLCKQCQVHSKLDKNSRDFQKFQQMHTDCKANFKGSAPAMEPEGAMRIFQRSFSKHGLHYTQYYGDGDSKSYSSVKNIYEAVGKKVEKLECIGHVQKRMGTALRKLKKEKKDMRGKGKLTDKIIDKLQNYYGIAIRSNIGNLESMKKAILSALFHCASSQENNYHAHCPQGKESWCGFQADKAENIKKYKPGPGLPLHVIAELKPIFAKLSEDDLLRKCLHGKTQNQNESFNRVIWDRVPKSHYVGRDIFEVGVYDAVAHFNEGSIATCLVLEKLGLQKGFFTEKICKELDRSRIYVAEYQEKELTKISRKKLRSKRKSKHEKDIDKEGESYGAGEF